MTYMHYRKQHIAVAVGAGVAHGSLNALDPSLAANFSGLMSVDLVAFQTARVKT